MSNGTGADDFITELRGSNDKSFSTVLPVNVNVSHVV